MRKRSLGKEARLCYSAHELMENRNTILIDFQVEPADGYAERRAALAMVAARLPGARRITVGADKGYDTRNFVECCRALSHLGGICDLVLLVARPHVMEWSQPRFLKRPHHRPGW